MSAANMAHIPSGRQHKIARPEGHIKSTGSDSCCVNKNTGSLNGISHCLDSLWLTKYE